MHAPSLGLVDCAGVREHLIPRAREPRPIVNSRRAAGSGAEKGNRRDFLGQDFFFTALTSLAKRIIPMDLARCPEKCGEVRDDFLVRSEYVTELFGVLNNSHFADVKFYFLGLNYRLDKITIYTSICIFDTRVFDFSAGVAATTFI